MLNLLTVLIPSKSGQKGIAHIVPLIVVVIVAAAILVVFLMQQQPKKSVVLITPSQLMPSVSATQARATICDLKKEGLFTQICQEKFNNVSKEDGEKIAQLVALLNTIQNDKNISDYDRLLLGQLLFALLPTKESPLTLVPESPSLVTKIKNFFTTNIIYAQESINNSGINLEEFRNQMKADLNNVVGNLPAGDNAWVINVMVSKYQWIDGERQPIYSDQYSESYDPYPGVSTETKDESKILYHVRSVVGSRSTSQTIVEGPFKGTGEMIVYSFSIMSWDSPPYGSDSVLTVAESGPEAKYLTSRRDLSEDNYNGENFLSDLLSKVEMPTNKQPKTEELNEKAPEDEEIGELDFPKIYPYDQSIMGSKRCPNFVGLEADNVVICHQTDEEVLQAYSDYRKGLLVGPGGDSSNECAYRKCSDSCHDQCWYCETANSCGVSVECWNACEQACLGVKCGGTDEEFMVPDYVKNNQPANHKPQSGTGQIDYSGPSGVLTEPR